MLEVALDAGEEWDSKSGWQKLAEAAVMAAVEESAFPQLASAERPVEISVTLTNDEQVKALNAEWRGKDMATNVLSFPMADAADLQRAKLAGPEMLIGDIILAYGVCSSEARDKGITVEQHTSHLLVHGTLHLLGYDHHEDGEAQDMEAREVRALERLGIANPYEAAA